MQPEEHYVSFAERRRLRRVQEANERRDRQFGERYSAVGMSGGGSASPSLSHVVPTLYYTPDRPQARSVSPPTSDSRSSHTHALHQEHLHAQQQQQHASVAAEHRASPSPTKAVSFVEHSPLPVTATTATTTTPHARHTHTRRSPTKYTKSLFQLGDDRAGHLVGRVSAAHADPLYVEDDGANSPPQRGRTESPQRVPSERRPRVRTPPLAHPLPSGGHSRKASATRKERPPLLPSTAAAHRSFAGRERAASLTESIHPRGAAPQPQPRPSVTAAPPRPRRRSSSARSLTSATSPMRQPMPASPAAVRTDTSLSASPIAHALQSQWVLLQQQLCTQEGTYPTLSATEQEKSLLLVLTRLPEEVGTILRDAGVCLPYLFAFAVAPLPTRRTQAVAMAALQAALTTMCTSWPKEATTSFLEEFFLGSHRALQALEAALTSLLASTAAPTEAEVAEGIEARSILSLRACSLDLLALVVRRSAAVATTLLTRPAYIHMLLQLLPQTETSDHEVCCIAATLHHCLCTVQDAAEVLVAYHTHHEVLRALQLALTLSYSGTGELQPHSSVTAVCTFVQILLQLTPCRAAFALLYREDHLCTLFRELLTMPWGDVVELACLWLFKLLECQPTEEGPLLVRRLLQRIELAPILATTFLWKDRVPQGLAAALCWRQMMLCEPAATGAAFAQDAGILMAFLHVVLTYPVQDLALSAAARARSSEATVQAGMLVLEVLHSFALCEALSTPEVRACLRLLLQDQLSPATIQQIRANVKGALQIVGGTYYSEYPVVAIEKDRLVRSRRNSRSCGDGHHHHSSRSDNSDSSDSDEAQSEADEGRDRSSMSADGDNEDEEIVYTGAQWRRLIRRALYALFPPQRASTATGSSASAATAASRREEVERSKKALLARQLQLSQSRMAAKDTANGLPSVRLGSLPPPFVQSPASIQYASAESKEKPAHRDSLADTQPPPSPGRSAALLQAQLHGKMSLREKSLPYAPAYRQLSVVRRVQLLGASMHHETVQCVLQLALHYLHSSLAPESVMEQQQREHEQGGVHRVYVENRAKAKAAAAAAATNNSSVCSRRQSTFPLHTKPEKEKNPWAPMTQVFYDGRRWAVSDLQEEDVLLFYVRFEFILEELPEAIEAVEGHLLWLHRQLQIQPTRRSQRRLVLNDLYMNVYPKIHFMLQYIHSCMGERAALQLLHDYDGGVLSSGNLLGVYEAIGALSED